MLIEIKSRLDQSVIFSHDCENNTIRLTVEAAVKVETNLSGSNLSGSDLSYSDLSGSDLSYSDLSGSDLSYSNLSGSDLSYSNLSYSNLSGSNLSGSNLRGSSLRGSNLSGSNLTDATYGIATLAKGLLQLRGLCWSVMIFDAHIKIGCEFHSTQEWADFTDDEISKMESGALDFWKKNRDMILLAAKTHQGELHAKPLE